MYIPILYLITFCFLGTVIVKANKHKAEWLLLLIILSYIKTCIMYLFEATTVFTVFTVGGTQVHLDDIVLIILLIYCMVNILYPFQAGKYFIASLLLLGPIMISLVRGIMNGTVGSEVFLSDTRKYVLFYSCVLCVFLCDATRRKYEQIVEI